MFRSQPSNSSDEVDHLLRNAQLRDELEPLFDESIGRVNSTVMSTRSENEFLASMLEWERAPILPISQWFEPELTLPHPDGLSGHQLYCIIFRDILPSQEKLLERRSTYLHWDCANINDDPALWLRYYASEAERELWATENDEPLPTRAELPYRRQLPKAPL